MSSIALSKEDRGAATGLVDPSNCCSCCGGEDVFPAVPTRNKDAAPIQNARLPWDGDSSSSLLFLSLPKSETAERAVVEPTTGTPLVAAVVEKATMQLTHPVSSSKEPKLKDIFMIGRTDGADSTAYYVSGAKG